MPRCGTRRAPSTTPTTAAALAIAAAAALAFDAAFLNGEGLRADARRHRLHVGARRAPLPAARDDAAPARRHARRVARARRARLALAALAAGSRSTSAAEAEAYRDELRAFLAEIKRPRRRRSSATGSPTTGYITPGVADAVGPRRDGARAARDRRGVPRREGASRPNIGVGAWALPTLIVLRHAGAAGAVDPADAARRDRAGASCSASRARAPTSRRSRRAPTRVEGGWVSTARRSGRRWPRKPSWGICLARTDPDASEARRHLVLHGRHEDARHRHPAAARAHRRRRCSTRCSSTTCSCPTTASSARSTTAGAARARRSPTSACTWAASNTIGGGVRRRAARDRGARAWPTTGSALAEAGDLVGRPATRSRCSASA